MKGILGRKLNKEISFLNLVIPLEEAETLIVLNLFKLFLE